MNVPLDIPVDYRIQVISVNIDARPPQAVVDVSGTRYQVTYQAPRGAPPLRENQFLSVVVPGMMVAVRPVNERYELDDVLYQLDGWQPA